MEIQWKYNGNIMEIKHKYNRIIFPSFQRISMYFNIFPCISMYFKIS